MLMFIRYMLFERGWSQDAAAQLLVDKLGYPYNNARPLIRRVIRNEALQRERWAHERLDENNTNKLKTMKAVAERRHAS
ncbi:MAG: hypothetical protein MZW92_31255 [Comamonadaceae bacterium]|nr:hypothetical protein [Comamonadaceae bacterium]